MTFFSPAAFEANSRCPGKPALEEFEELPAHISATEEGQKRHAAACLLAGVHPLGDFGEDAGVLAFVERVRERQAAHKAAGAANVQVLVEQRLNIELITGERGALGIATCLLLAEYADYADLDVISPHFTALADTGRGADIEALAAMLKFALLHTMRAVYVCTFDPLTAGRLEISERVPDELYSFGMLVTQAAQLSLSLRGDVTALSHLIPGVVQCERCRVKYRCPELAKQVAREAYGDAQAALKRQAVPVLPSDSLERPEDLAERMAVALTNVPLIEHWCRAVREQAEAMLQSGERIPGFKLVQAENRLLEIAPSDDPRRTYHAGAIARDFDPEDLV